MCKLCEERTDYAWIDKGWLYMEDAQIPNGVVTFPVHYCPWCGRKLDDERMMPKIVTRDMKEQMREQEAENYDPSEDLC